MSNYVHLALFAGLIIHLGVTLYRNYFRGEPHRERTFRCEICKNSIETSSRTDFCLNGHRFHTQCWNSLKELGSSNCPVCGLDI